MKNVVISCIFFISLAKLVGMPTSKVKLEILFSINDEIQINITETSASAEGLFLSEVLVKVLQGTFFFSKQLKDSSLYFYYTQKFGIKP